MSLDFSSLLRKTEHILAQPSSRDARLKALCYLLRHNVPHYDWVGFYLARKGASRELVLGPYEGEETNRVRIPFGRGIQGEVAESRKTRIDQDDREGTSTAGDVRSEIVVPILVDGELVAELDVDSSTACAFKPEDRLFLDRVCDAVSLLFRNDRDSDR